MWVDEEHGDRAAKQLAHHVQQEQAQPAGGGALLFVRELDGVEAILEV
jgi:hypothetical protein